ncbi:hypothetical protein CBW24_08660 [Pacificitalea manganoxidans]|uniref:Uncharacterized protein n=1 Tax=Pacificitalea manganoxidans TaxID=1411902 RepID=A0A291LZE5_9RHOB|nr:hypothetical protein [Pacificitalea manganoxidans]ATI42071.1 hypothetical protein CBW24_08660 [Pacificitalea manganoxidans]MDR6308132.1 hypothetical protein [Pacificitalea manganoxidans]
MKTRLDATLKDVPAAIRRAMLEDAPQLEPGAAQVMGRFWSAVRAGKGSLAMPPAEAYRDAAASESTFRCLLRALARYAPHVSTALAKVVSYEWYARRQNPAAKVAPTVETTIGAAWPETWRRMKPDLDDARIKTSTRQRYIASIERCATIVAEGLASEAHGFVAARELSEAFVFHPDPERRVKPVTAANYLEGLIAMRVISRDLRDQAELAEKNKYERLSRLMERGGYAHVADRIRELRERAHDLPAHSAARRRCMQQAVVCAVIMNKPPRKGDLVSWRFGHQIVREIDGTWRAEWAQEKTRAEAETGAIWPEICEILDEWILDGRPDRLIHIRYQELVGSNWLSLDHSQPYRNLPTELTKAAIGVPSHELRTLAADYMRRHDPARAADVIATHLGHGTRKAGKAYRAECEGAAGEAIWQRVRKTIAAQSEKSTGHHKARNRAPHL